MPIGNAGGIVAFESGNFSAREKFRPAYDRVADVLVGQLAFETALDVGCGQGFLLDALLARDVDAYGVELSRACFQFASEQARERIDIRDFLWWTQGKCYDLVCCIEMAEHIAPEHSHVLVKQLCDQGAKQIFFTAATLYQQGHGHINCRPHTDWIYFFHCEGWKLDIAKTIDLRARMGALPEAPWIGTNAMFFVKE